jgi:DNA-binding response OmpR family regulator
MKILAVDDEPFILEMIPLLAARVGFPQVQTASSVDAALKLLTNAEPEFDCLIFDINMPEVDGIELCRLVRQLKAYRQTPIIMLTAMSDKQFVDLAFQAGATDYATKPFDITELGARLRLANDLLVARREAEALRVASPEATKKPNMLSDALEIVGVPKLVDMVSLKNYLKQLSRTGATASQVMAFGVQQVENLHAKATSDEFQYALREVASAIGFILAPNLALMAYSGNGTFLVVSYAATPLDPEHIESEVQYFLDERDLQYDDSTPMNFEVLAGSAVRPISSSLDDIERSIERAIARMIARSQAQKTMRMPPSIR